MDKVTSSIFHLYFIAHLQHLRVHCMDVSNHTIGSWQLHMTSEILYTYIWRTEEVIKPYGPLPYSRKHSTNLLTWFIITLCHLAKPTLQLFGRKKPAEEGREDLRGELWLRQSWAVLRACGCTVQSRPRWQHQVPASRVQTPQFGLWGFVSTRKTNGSVLSLHVSLALLWWQELRWRGCRGQHQKLSHVTEGQPTPPLSCSPTLCREVGEGRGWARAI